MTRNEKAVYQAAYKKAVMEHPKGGGLLGGTARMLCAQVAGQNAVRAMRKAARK
jgi:hypothetical protein